MPRSLQHSICLLKAQVGAKLLLWVTQPDYRDRQASNLLATCFDRHVYIPTHLGFAEMKYSLHKSY